MAPLKAVELDYQIIDSNFQSFCASHGILSVEDFLIHDVYELVAFARQQPTSEKLEQGITQILSIIDAQHQPWVNGMELMDDALHRKHVLPTGCEGVDLLLGGGLRVGQLTELVGPSSSGKTQVCLLAASYFASKHMSTVLYLDTGNSFSTQRIADFVSRFSNYTAGQRTFENVMNNILCHSVFDIFTMFNVLQRLEFDLKSQLKKGGLVRLLIVDSISSLITPILGNTSSQGRALMTSAGYLLKKLAYEHDIVVLVTNHTVGGEKGIPKPALGQTWKSVAHVRLLLSADHGNDTRSISVLKHPSMDLFLASIDTTSIAMEWALAELINHPEVLKKARDDIDRAVEKGRRVGESDVPNLSYIQAIMKEIIRLHPPLPFVARKCVEQCKVDRYVIDKDSVIHKQLGYRKRFQELG